MTRWTVKDYHLRHWGNTNGHPVTVTPVGPVFVTECGPCGYEARALSRTAGTRLGLAHLQAAKTRQGAS